MITLGTLFAIIKGFLAICFVFGSIVLVHELGHFLTAKWSGIWVIEFALGFGKRMVRFRIGDTLYSLRPFPLGGFVRLAGMDTPEDTEEKKPDEPGTDAEKAVETPPEPVDPDDVTPELAPDDPRGYPAKPRSLKMLVLAAGSIMNLVWAVVIFFIMFTVFGGPLSNIYVTDATPGEPAALAGIRSGDVVTAINGTKIREWTDGIKVIQANGGSPITLDVVRDHPEPRPGFGGGLVQMNRAVTPGMYELYRRETLQIKVTPTGGPGSGRIGIKLGANTYDFQVLALDHAATKAFESTRDIIAQTLGGLLRMLSRQTEADVAGPVKIMQMITQQSQKGFVDLLQMTALLSINIGLLNLMPFPVLDGGRILFLLIEAFLAFINFLTGLKLALDPKWEENIHFIGMLFLLVVLVMVTVGDIRGLFH
ncbi:MAG TPA: M50 family metallopeptidase [Candidatus Ozemobacteraceae bacterium]|nr:M50 family metallopeptidase [Candidatus Ozemobacteraceae bacterium]